MSPKLSERLLGSFSHSVLSTAYFLTTVFEKFQAPDGLVGEMLFCFVCEFVLGRAPRTTRGGACASLFKSYTPRWKITNPDTK